MKGNLRRTKGPALEAKYICYSHKSLVRKLDRLSMMPNLTPAKTRQTGKWTYFMSNFCSRQTGEENRTFMTTYLRHLVFVCVLFM